MIRGTVSVAGVLTTRGKAVWERELRAKVRAGAAAAMKVSQPDFKRAMRAQMAGALNIKKRAALNLLTTRVYDSRPNEMPAMYLGAIRPASRFLDAHETGGVIVAQGKGMLIPLLGDKRMGRKAFRKVLDDIFRSGAYWWKQEGERVILMAEYQTEYGRSMGQFRRQYRASTGAKRVKAGTDIPIAVLVKRVRLKKRLRVQETVMARVPALTRRIEQYTRFDN